MKTKHRPLFRIGIAVMCMVASLSATTVHAAEPAPAAPQQVNGADDANKLELGTWCQDDYPGTVNDLPGFCARSARNLTGSLTGIWPIWSSRWSNTLQWENNWAWEKDFKRAALGGNEAVELDKVDFAFFSGHGSDGAYDNFYRRTSGGLFWGNLHDDYWTVPGDAYRSWGDGDVEWVGFQACLQMRGENRGYWANTLNGGHLVMGFDTIALGSNMGSELGWQIRIGRSMSQAWFNAADITMSPGARSYGRSIRARIVAEEACQFNDTQSASCGDYAPNGVYWWLDHRFGSGPDFYTLSAANAANGPSDQPATLPVLNVVSALPSESDLAKLSGAFGFNPNTPAALDDQVELYRASEGGLDLSVDKQGKFSFSNLGELWVVPTSTAVLAQRAAHAPDMDPKQVADAFLASKNLLPADAVFLEVLTDTVTSAQQLPVSNTLAAEGAAPAFVEQVLDEQPIVYQVVYGRQFTVTQPTGQKIVAPVFGPGATLRVYVSVDGKVIGTTGGFRAALDAGMQNKAGAAYTMLSADQAASLFKIVGNSINLLPTMFSADAMTVTRSAIGYYEQPLGTHQDVILPTFQFDIDLTQQAQGNRPEETLQSLAYVPAVAEALPPLAKITAYPEAQTNIEVGQMLTLTAADSSKKLSDLGLGANLGFVMGTGPYTYTWTLQNSGRVIGTGLEATYKASSEDFVGGKNSTDLSLVIVLTVTDSTGKIARASKAFSFITPLAPIRFTHLPVVIK